MKIINLSNIWFTQKILKRKEIIPDLIKNINNLPKIKINILPDNSIEIKNGHHRMTALWISGVREMNIYDFDVFYPEIPRLRRFWQVNNCPLIKELEKEYVRHISE